MAVNKVIFGEEVLIDLTSDTITADKLLVGTTAHLPSGEIVSGTLFQGSPDSVSVEINGEIVTYVKQGNVSLVGLVDSDLDSYMVRMNWPDGEDADVGNYIPKES